MNVFENDFSTILKQLDCKRIEHLTNELLNVQGECDAPGVLRSAQWCRTELERAGAEQIEFIEVPGDGKSVFNDCIIPKVWESTGRSFLRKASGEMLADSTVEPRAIPPWSAPTPSGGITAPVALTPERGCWYLSRKLNPEVLTSAVQNGCAGVILDTVTASVPPGTVRWENGSGFVGWYPVDGDPEVTMFAIPPEKGMALRAKLEHGEKIVLHGEVRRINRPGVWPTVTGVIPGEETQEILFCAHLYEPFGADNAVSTPILLELCRVLRALPAARRYTLRFWFGMERYGLAHYVSDVKRSSKILYLLNADCIANQKTKEEFRFTFFGSAPATPFFADDFFGNEAEKLFAPDKVKKEYGGLTGDTFVSDIEPGIPSMLLESCDSAYWHLSCPQFDGIDWALVPKAAAFYGSCALCLSRRENPQRKGELERLLASPVSNACALLEQELKHRYFQKLASALPFENFVLPEEPENALCSGVILRRKRAIPLLSMADLPKEERRNPPPELPEFRLIWSLIDGKRSMEQILLAAGNLTGNPLSVEQRKILDMFLKKLSTFLEKT